MNIANNPLVLDGTDMASTITSDPIWLANIINYNIQIVFTGSPVGTFTLQISGDAGNPNAPFQVDRDYQITHWTTMQGSSQAIAASGDHSYEVQNSGHRWARLIYTKTSGTGTITSCRFALKGA
jgi:hypothetical protein